MRAGSRGALATLALAAALAAAAPAAAADTRFDPALHGFRFVNAFKGQILVTVPRIGTVDLAKWPFGLCGGMAFSALDTFFAGGRAPADTKPPSPGDRLRVYLRERLLDSLLPDGARTVRRFVEWMGRPIEDKKLSIFGKITGLATLTRREIEQRIHPALASGRPVPIGIVKVDLGGAPWENHTVLATGDLRDADGDWVIEIYDPNHPGRLTYLQVSRRVQSWDPRGESLVSARRWRGLFALPYAYERPYWLRAGRAPGTTASLAASSRTAR